MGVLQLTDPLYSLSGSCLWLLLATVLVLVAAKLIFWEQEAYLLEGNIVLGSH